MQTTASRPRACYRTVSGGSTPVCLRSQLLQVRPYNPARLALTPDDRHGVPESHEAFSDRIHIANAGLVVVAAFLPQLFEQLDALEDAPDGRPRVRTGSVSRLAHLLQFDVLIDRVPWTMTPVAHSWMPDRLFAEW